MSRNSGTISLAAAMLLAMAVSGQAKPGQKAEAAAAGKHGEDSAVAEIGAPAPDFTLKDTEGKEHRLSDLVGKGQVVVLEWFNPDCPFVKKHHQKNKSMATTRAAYADKDVVWLAVNSGAPGKQGAGLEHNRKAIADYGIEYPLLLDEQGTVGRLYGAKTTPHMFVISGGTLVYAGAIDDNPAPGGSLGKTNYVVAALDAVLAGEEVETSHTKPYGCSVKYGTAVP